MANKRKYYKYDFHYRPKLHRNYNYDYRDDESSYLDGSTTSAISYDESVKRSRVDSPYSKSEYGRPRKITKGNQEYKSSIPENDYYYSQEESKKNYSKQTKNAQNLFYQFDNNNDKYERSEKKSQPRPKNNGYDNYYSFDDEGEHFEYDKYFEKTRRNGKKTKKISDDIVGEDRRKINKQNKYSKKENDYQVFSYKEPNLHEKVFESRDKTDNTPLSSEIEMRNIDYPLLAFKDNNVKQGSSKASNVVYLPTVYCKDKKTKTKGNKPRNQPDGTQVFSANIKEKQNIFTLENTNNKKQISKNAAVPDLKTEESLISKNTQSEGDSKAKTSTETQTEESLVFEHGLHNIQIFKHAESVLGSILEKAGLQSKLKDSSSLKKSKVSERNNPKMKNKELYAYQIDVDIDREKNIFGSKASPRWSLASKIDPIRPSVEVPQLEYKLIKDTLHDNYPVTRDYIKVGESFLMQTKPITVPGAKQSPTTSHNTKNNYKQLVLDIDKTNGKNNYSGNALKHQHLQVFRSTVNNTFESPIDQRSSKNDLKEKQQTDVQRISSLNSEIMNVFPTNIKGLSENISNNARSIQPTYQDNEVLLTQNQNLSTVKPIVASVVREEPNYVERESEIKRPTIDSTTKESRVNSLNKDSFEPELKNQSITKESRTDSPYRTSTVRGRKSKSVEKPNYVERESEIKRPTTESTTKESRVNSLNKDSSGPELKNQFIIKESTTDSPYRKSTVIGRKSISVVKDSRLDSPNRNSTLVDRKSQSVLKESRADSQSRKSGLMDRKSQSSMIENRPRSGDRISTLMDRKSQSTTKESRPDGSNRNSTMMDRKDPITELPNANSTLIERTRQSVIKESRPDGGNRNSRMMDRKSQSIQKESRADGLNKDSPLDDRKSPSMVRESRCDVPINATQNVGSENKNKKYISNSFCSNNTVKPTKTKSILRTNLFSRRNKIIKEKTQDSQDSVKQTNKSESKDTNLNTTEEDNFGKKQKKSKAPSKMKLLSKKKDDAFSEDSEKKSLNKTSSQVTFPNHSKSKSKIWSFVKRSKTKNTPEASERLSQATSKISSENKPDKKPDEPEKKPESENQQLKERDTTPKKEKSCECIIQYVKKARDCGNFFLGSTLHEQILDFLKVI